MSDDYDDTYHLGSSLDGQPLFLTARLLLDSSEKTESRSRGFLRVTKAHLVLSEQMLSRFFFTCNEQSN